MRRVLAGSAMALSLLLAPHDAGAADAVVVVSGLGFPEGTIFVGDALYFVDYVTSDVLRLVGNTVERVWHQDGCAANGLVATDGGLLVACYASGTFALVSTDGRLLETISRDDAGHPFVAPNDLAADRSGGVYFTGSGADGTISGKVYYRAADHRVREVAADIDYANGLVVSPDGGLLYVAETHTGRLLVFPIAADGALGARRRFVQLSDILAAGRHYSPDGVRIDRKGNLFVGLYNGGGFAVIAPDGTLIRQVDLPAPHHANLAISPDGKFVYVTAVRDGADGSYIGELLRVANPLAE